jgi:uncharacterized RDD family membrane protein YckC
MSSVLAESGPAGMTGVAYVGFWRRALAAAIDLALLLFVVIPAIVWYVGADWTMAQGIVAFVVNWGLPGAAVIAFWTMKGATPGKMAISAVVVDARTHAPVDFWQALARYLGYFISTVPLLVGFAWIGVDGRKQGWHDKMARTVVIHRPR